MTRRTAIATTMVVALHALPSKAKNDGARWDPGNPVTSPVEPAVDADQRTGVGGGVYGRFDGDLDIGVGVGVDVTDDQAAGLVRSTLHYYSMAGIYVGYADAFDEAAPTYQRLFSVGVDIRPMFVPRWVENRQRGPGAFDLTVDSLSLSFGAFWTKPSPGSFGDERGFEGAIGLGFPIMLKAAGLWLEGRAGLRWSDSQAERGAPVRGTVSVLLSWHSIAETPLLQRADP